MPPSKAGPHGGPHHPRHEWIVGVHDDDPSLEGHEGRLTAVTPILGPVDARVSSSSLHRLGSVGSTAIITVGQLSRDTIISLHGPLTRGDHHFGDALSLPGGTAAIVAHNIAALGGQVTFCGQVGDSVEDRATARALRESGVDSGPLITTARGLRVLIIVETDGERTMFAVGDKPDWSTLALPVQRGDLVFFEGWHLLGERPDPDYVSLIERASDCGATVVLDVCTANDASVKHRDLLAELPIDILLANSAEAEALDLQSQPPCQTVVVHRGTEPTVVISGTSRREFPVDAVKALDTTGAGDTFAAGFLLALHHSAGIDAAVGAGLAAARAVVQVPGPLLPTSQRSLISSKWTATAV